MPYEAKDFSELLGTEGFSDAMLENHFKLYQGYVANTNKVAELLSKEEAGTPQYAELKRRFGWEFNGMRLHECYFGNISKEGAEPDEDSEIYEKMEEEFGSFDNWEKDFRSAGAMRGIGWVALYYDKQGDRLFNCWINEHDAGHPAGCVPLLVMDVFEHAFITDYGLKRAEYIEAFMKAVDWGIVSERFEDSAG